MIRNQSARVLRIKLQFKQRIRMAQLTQGIRVSAVRIHRMDRFSMIQLVVFLFHVFQTSNAVSLDLSVPGYSCITHTHCLSV